MLQNFKQFKILQTVQYNFFCQAVSKNRFKYILCKYGIKNKYYGLCVSKYRLNKDLNDNYLQVINAIFFTVNIKKNNSDFDRKL